MADEASSAAAASKEGFHGMHPHEATPLADQDVRWDTGAGGHLTTDDFCGQDYRIGIAGPVGVPTQRTVKSCACTLKCGGYALEVVLSAVSLHGPSISESGEDVDG